MVLTDNLARRQLNTGQRAYLAYQYQQLLSVGAGRRTDLEPLENSTKVDARQAAAEKAGVSSYSVSAMKTLIESGDDDLLQDVLSGRQSVSAAARYLRNEAREARLPEGGSGVEYGVEPSGGPVYTVVRGDSSDLIAEIARIYLKPGAVVCDVTIGLGVFWQKINIDEIELYGTDIAMEKPVDLRKLPYPGGFADVLVLDPPHQHDAALPITGARYNARRTVGNMTHDQIISELYGGGLKEAWRVLKPGGYAWVKCCDEIVSSKQRWSHIEILKITDELGFEAVDLFILHRTSPAMVQEKRQKHARKKTVMSRICSSTTWAQPVSPRSPKMGWCSSICLMTPWVRQTEASSPTTTATKCCSLQACSVRGRRRQTVPSSQT